MAYRTLLRSFILAPPRAEICCEMGRLFMEDQAYESAIYWYQAALALPQRPELGGFVMAEQLAHQNLWVPDLIIFFVFSDRFQFDK